MPSLAIGCFAVVVGLAYFVVVDAAEAPVRIDGGWSPWSTISSPCMRQIADGSWTLATCGGGTRTRIRSCTNPTPQGLRPKPCVGEDRITEACNTDPCDMTWSDWSACSANCGRGNKRRYTLCAETAGGNLTDCNDLGLTDQAFEHIKECNTWNKNNCSSPCSGYTCMEFANCVDVSDDEDPKVECVCQLGREMNAARDGCIIPPPKPPTPRPIPTLAPAVKMATTAVTKTASTLLIIFVGTTLFLFASLRIFDDDRVIQMNMEIALILAHIALLLPSMHEHKEACQVISIFIHFFFTACFMFMFLESLHTYSLVAFVVKKNGLLTKTQNVVVGKLKSIYGLYICNVKSKAHLGAGARTKKKKNVKRRKLIKTFSSFCLFQVGAFPWEWFFSRSPST